MTEFMTKIAKSDLGSTIPKFGFRYRTLQSVCISMFGLGRIFAGSSCFFVPAFLSLGRPIDKNIIQRRIIGIGGRSTTCAIREMPRRSPRLSALSCVSKKEDDVSSSKRQNDEDKQINDSKVSPKRGRPSKRKSSIRKDAKEDTATSSSSGSNSSACLPRTLENSLQKKKNYISDSNHDENIVVMGVDEAGRGPLAGPVVAAAAIVPTDIPGIVDSKKLTREETREDLYEQIVKSSNVRYAVAIVDAQTIDEINILQASLLAMRMAVSILITTTTATNEEKPEPTTKKQTKKQPTKQQDGSIQQHSKPCASHQGTYVVCSSTEAADGAPATKKNKPSEVDNNIKQHDSNTYYYAFIDGNKLPQEMPCDAEAVIKGDSKEYSIAAASIIAKVTRDRLMHQYHDMYPHFDLKQNKGYPTAKHMLAVHKHGASPIHRRTFAPLKHMTFDENGKVVTSSE